MQLVFLFVHIHQLYQNSTREEIVEHLISMSFYLVVPSFNFYMYKKTPITLKIDMISTYGLIRKSNRWITKFDFPESLTDVELVVEVNTLQVEEREFGYCQLFRIVRVEYMRVD